MGRNQGAILKFYIKYREEIFIYLNLCAALVFKKYVGGKLYFKKPAVIQQGELFDEYN